ncbi:hypothetical protein HaLaN_21859, partial [Haematococcus lacustris]
CAPSSPPFVAISELFLASTWHGKLTFSSLGAPALVLAASAQQHKVTLSKWTGTAEQQWTVQDGHMAGMGAPGGTTSSPALAGHAAGSMLGAAAGGAPALLGASSMQA